jgi:hypothetical protein
MGLFVLVVAIICYFMMGKNPWKWFKDTRMKNDGDSTTREPLPAPTPMMTQPFVRLSEAKEIQLAFQQEMVALYNEAGATTEPPVPPKQVPTIVTDIIDGKGFAKAVDELEQKGSLQTLGFKPEQIRVLKCLAELLVQCSRVEATAQNFAVFKHLFHPTKPTTPTVADAMEEMVAAIGTSIEPKASAEMLE